MEGQKPKRKYGPHEGMVISRTGLTVGPAGWVSTPGPDGSAVHVRLRRGDDNRLEISDLMVTGAPISADLLRKIQPGRIEAEYNAYIASVEAEEVMASAALASATANNAEDAEVAAAEGVLARAQLMVTRLREDFGDPGSDEDLTIGQLRASSYFDLPEPSPREPLQRPDGIDPDGFYRRVAEAYRSAVQESGRPAVVLAEEAGVPVTTVHRWVREARRREYLPPGRKGKVG